MTRRAYTITLAIKAKQRKCRPLLNRESDLVTQGTDKAKLLNAFFISVFIDKVFQAPGLREKLPASRQALTRGLPVRSWSLKVHEMQQLHPRMPRELAHILARPLSNIFKRLWRSRDFPDN